MYVSTKNKTTPIIATIITSLNLFLLFLNKIIKHMMIPTIVVLLNVAIIAKKLIVVKK